MVEFASMVAAEPDQLRYRSTTRRSAIERRLCRRDGRGIGPGGRR